MRDESEGDDQALVVRLWALVVGLALLLEPKAESLASADFSLRVIK